MYETPEHLAERYNRDVATVPKLGLGFTKTTLDAKLYERLLDHFRNNVRNFVSEPGSDYLLTENERSYPSLLCFNEAFNRRLMSELKEAHEEWSGMSLKEAACYGIRAYQPKSYLYNHIDTIQTHVVSSTICVDHKLNSPWPLYIEDLDGQPHEVEIEPGEMVFYEGARLMHGRPYPLDGEYYANIFVHYTPLDWQLGSPPSDEGNS